MASMMLLAHSVSIVVVGDGFKPSMFKPGDFFDGALDDKETMVQGPFCQFQYRSGLYGLSVGTQPSERKNCRTGFAVVKFHLQCRTAFRHIGQVQRRSVPYRHGA